MFRKTLRTYTKNIPIKSTVVFLSNEHKDIFLETITKNKEDKYMYFFEIDKNTIEHLDTQIKFDATVSDDRIGTKELYQNNDIVYNFCGYQLFVASILWTFFSLSSIYVFPFFASYILN